MGIIGLGIARVEQAPQVQRAKQPALLVEFHLALVAEKQQGPENPHPVPVQLGVRSLGFHVGSPVPHQLVEAGPGMARLPAE